MKTFRHFLVENKSAIALPSMTIVSRSFNFARAKKEADAVFAKALV